jgi:hypothetical protein
LLGRGAGEVGDRIVATVERVLADDRIPREVRLRDSYLLVRQQLVEELRGAAEGERQCRAQAHVLQPTTASS